ncbi:MAG: DUF1624 domain-containing protein [Rubrivivax sp.]|nr:DUF1624 domain-containing protein [Rubrivivax sp.]
MLWMTAFHFSFDLNHFQLLQPRQNFYTDPFWTGQRTAIVTLFLLCAGAGQALALHAAQGWPRFWKRWAQIAACAALVSLGSALMFPRSWISFGVLHGLAVMLILCRLAAPWGRALWPLGALAIALPWLWSHPVFNGPWLHWTGLVTRKPVTEDWVPVLPWLGVMFWGMAGTQALLRHRPHWLLGAVARPLQPLVLLGRWSLSFYMLHQPLLIGALMAFLALRRALGG